MSSDPHFSRLSFRSVIKGYQRYHADGRDFRLNSTNYLILPEGSRYFNAFETPRKTESIIVAFSPKVQKEVEIASLKSESSLLDNPDYLLREEVIEFLQSSYPIDEHISTCVDLIKKGIITGDKEPIFFQQMQYDLMGLMLSKHLATAGKRDIEGHLPTRNELYRRTRLAVDYIEAHFAEKISLDALSKIASLSPFHFIRTFKHFYNCTPVEYLTRTRLNYAQYLLAKSDLPIALILIKVGFKNHSSFSRLFLNHFGSSPRDYRVLNNKSNNRTIIPFLG